MEEEINNLKNSFVKIVDSIQKITSVFEKIDVKLSNITSYYIELIEKNKEKLYVFSLDSFRFQIALLERELDENKTFFKVINNRIYCEYYKFCKTMCEYIFEKYSDPHLVNVAKAINETELPIYDAVDPKKEYGLCFVLTIHDNIIDLFKCLYANLHTKESELKEYLTKKKMGLNIDNFVFTFDYNYSIVRDKIRMFLDYMTFFHKMHLKNLTLMGKKLLIMRKEIENDLTLDGNENEAASIPDSDFSDDESLESSANIKKMKKEKISRKKESPAYSKINSFLKKKPSENEMMAKEDKDNTSGEVSLTIQEKGKRKKKSVN